ncbi:MAG: hypothetical protein LBL31_05810 [Spirochaetaceae bacterium]|jgi:hypothetical protein|nr:hypothetical protein [Spirochaetaceae bacterium]
MADDNYKALLTLLVGVMAGIEGTDKTVVEIFSAQASKDVTAVALGKLLNKTVMRIAVALSYRLTGKSVLKSVWKVIPFAGGLVSGGITLFTFKPMCNKLKENLHKSMGTTTKEVSLNGVW